MTGRHEQGHGRRDAGPRDGRLARVSAGHVGTDADLEPWWTAASITRGHCRQEGEGEEVARPRHCSRAKPRARQGRGRTRTSGGGPGLRLSSKKPSALLTRTRPSHSSPAASPFGRGRDDRAEQRLAPDADHRGADVEADLIERLVVRFLDRSRRTRRTGRRRPATRAAPPRPGPPESRRVVAPALVVEPGADRGVQRAEHLPAAVSAAAAQTRTGPHARCIRSWYSSFSPLPSCWTRLR